MAEMESMAVGLANDGIVGSAMNTDEGIAQTPLGSPSSSAGIASDSVLEGAGLVSNTQTPQGLEPAAGEPYTLEMGDDEGLPLLKQQLESFTGTCRELGLSKKQAEQMLAWQKDRLRESEAETQRNTEMVVREWNTEIRNDSEFGGIRYTRTIADARAALQTFDPDGSLRQLLKDTYGEYHPDVIRFVARVGRAISEHRFLTSEAHAEPKETPLQERFYGKSGTEIRHGI
ncbi:hypothetical protein [Akkermansia sp.]|uniref:hypothetical protein n=1 Tax=Akkermansia sp. TaxID=1872421 RepID=UPI0025BCFBFE|nr:hypothetical protein [Akkermansia sp.]MCD8272413.1 hypothetical protein [Akkermansia sp.]